MSEYKHKNLISELEVLLTLAEHRNQTMCVETLQNAINTILSQESEIEKLKTNAMEM